ncbi:MAG: hypothetical protein ACC726_14760, partial [Chloroflexota bacterium]
MSKAKWWVCDSCKSLNDLPANKCYKCRERKPKTPTLIDDQFDQVGGNDKRVGITVDLADVSDLVAHDPKETQESREFVDVLPTGDRIKVGEDGAPVAGGESPGQPRPLREPTKRGISEAGGLKWHDEPTTAAPSSETQAAGPPQGHMMPQGQTPPPGAMP